MPTTTKNGNGASPNRPALDFEFIERRESDVYLLDVRVLEMLDQYTQYIESIRGKRPTKDQVVEKALDKVLSADTGFQKYLSAASGKPTLKQSPAAQADQPAKAQRNIPTAEKGTEALRT